MEIFIAAGSALIAVGALVVSVVAVRYAKSSAESARRSAEAAERQAVAAEAMLPPPAPPVQWEIRLVGGIMHTLRNVGSQAATAVRRANIPPPNVDLVRLDLPDDGVLRPGESVDFIVMSVAELPSAREIFLVWDGQDEPVPVPLPIP